MVIGGMSSLARKSIAETGTAVSWKSVKWRNFPESQCGGPGAMNGCGSLARVPGKVI